MKPTNYTGEEKEMNEGVPTGAVPRRVSYLTPICTAPTHNRSATILRIWIGRLLALALVLSAILFMWRTYAETGLFISLGMDYGLYVAQATVMGGDDPTKIYDKSMTNVVYRHLLDTYGHDPGYDPTTPGTWAAHVPYPPIFAWMMQLFTWMSPPVSLLLWGGVNVVLALWIGWRVATHCQGADKTTIMLLFLGSYPVVLNLHVGQIQILLAWFMTECYLALRAGKDFRAGIWLGCILLKPHYGLLLGLLLLWKCRWKTVLGAAVTGSVIVAGSLVAGGLHTLMAYPQAFSDMVQFRGDSPIVMLNWRSVVLDWYPSIYWRSGIILTVLLGIATILCVGWIWRGPWNVSAADFPAKMLLTLLATIIVLYHSHPYGAAIVVMPLAAVVLSEGASRLGKGIACAGAIVPTIIFTTWHAEPMTDWDISLQLVFASQILKATVIALCMHTFVGLIRAERVGNAVLETSRVDPRAGRFLAPQQVSAHQVETTSPGERRASNW